MTKDAPLPWSDPYRLWFAASIMAGVIAASAIYGILGSIFRNYPETY